MKHALTFSNKIRPILEESEQVDLDIAVKFADGTISEDWELVRADMIFPDLEAAKKYLFMRKLKKGS